MPSIELTRRTLLGSVSATTFGLLPYATAARALSPAQTSGVDVPQGQIERAVGELDRIIANVMKRSGVPGIAVAVVHGGNTLYAKGFGVREIGSADEITADTAFQIASLSKSVGATVVATQVSRGIVSWDSRMRDLLPWFSLSDPDRTEKLTIGDLYSHRSGLPDHAGDDLEDLGFDRTTILERLRLLPLSPFRISYAYTNFGLTAAAEAVAQAAGTDWENLSAEMLYQSLGMINTSSRFDDFMASNNRATPHTRTDNGFAALLQRDPDPESPAGGVSSTVDDLAKWLKLILANGTSEGKQIFTPEALLPAISPQSISGRPPAPDARASFYGYGFGVSVGASGRVVISHSGAFLMGTGTNFAVIPSLDLGIVVLTNASPVGAAESISASFNDIAQFGHETRDWYAGYSGIFESFFVKRGRTVGHMPPAGAAAPLPAATCIGTYSNPYFGSVEVQEDGDDLVLAAGPEPQLYPLQPWDGAVMVFDFVTENAPIGSRSTLTFGGITGSLAQTVEVELFAETEPALFTRV
ncbi:serine hydrolase [Roseibium album]|uniref:serine hydrolase n=1 Tax=Roseibium album TaxID=311410 RepID=UPI0024907B22|nr:serine hydrolase [Roseibium album]